MTIEREALLAIMNNETNKITMLGALIRYIQLTGTPTEKLFAKVCDDAIMSLTQPRHS